MLLAKITHQYAVQVVQKTFMSTLIGDCAIRENSTPRNRAHNLTNTASFKLNDNVSTKHKNSRKLNQIKIPKQSRNFEKLLFSQSGNAKLKIVLEYCLKRNLYGAQCDGYCALFKSPDAAARVSDATCGMNELHQAQAVGYKRLGIR